jgi:hypothetical protein
LDRQKSLLIADAVPGRVAVGSDLGIVAPSLESPELNDPLSRLAYTLKGGSR